MNSTQAPEAGTDPVTLALTGMLPAVLIGAAAAAFVVSVLLLKLYRRSVLRAMNERGGAADPAPPAGAGPGPAAPLSVAKVEIRRPGDAAGGILDESLAAPWRSALVYAGAGAAFAAIMTAAWLLATRDAALPAAKLLLLFWTYFWPGALSANLVAGSTRAARRGVLAAYFAILLGLMAWALYRNPRMGWHELPLFWIITNGPPTILAYAFLARPIRAVGPLVLAFMVLAGTGSQVALAWLGGAESRMRAAVEAGAAVGLGGHGTFWSVFALGFIGFGALGWAVLKWLGSRYRRKRLSDQSLMLDSVWLLFAVTHAIGLVFEGPAWIASGLVAFAGHKAAALAGNARLKARRNAPPRNLLVLRVFSLGKRSERLFDALRAHWLRLGSISLIAGPDLVTTNVEPHEFLDFVSGKLSRQFVKDDADLERRVADLDLAPDPDGRYRVNEFFCHADTWQATMRRLAGRCDAVLMDLRSFSPSNQGCLYELGRLLDAVDLARVVFVTDATTDGRFLEQALQRLWQAVGADSPNYRQAGPVASLLTVEEIAPPTLRTLLGRLLVPLPSRA
jgi:hypothetical protein